MCQDSTRRQNNKIFCNDRLSLLCFVRLIVLPIKWFIQKITLSAIPFAGIPLIDVNKVASPSFWPYHDFKSVAKVNQLPGNPCKILDLSQKLSLQKAMMIFKCEVMLYQCCVIYQVSDKNEFLAPRC